MKINLPVITLNNIVLLPNSEIRIELEDELNKNIISTAELFHNNTLLAVMKHKNNENINLSNIGIVANIKHKIELPDGKIRVIISGLSRAIIHEYMGLNCDSKTLECIASRMTTKKINDEKLLCEKLYKEINVYVKTIPHAPNSFLSSIKDMCNLDKMTDIVVNFLKLSSERLYDYLSTFDPKTRLQMILDDIYQEKKMFQIEKQIDAKVQKNIDDSQKEYFLREKVRLIKEELGDISLKDDEISNLHQKVSLLNAPPCIIERLNKEIRRYENLSHTSPEVSNVRNYIDWLLELPWNYVTNDNDDIVVVKEKLNQTHSGLEEVKTRIIEYLAVKQMTNTLKGPILCFIGPPGVGKTSLAMTIAASINRKFVKMSVGGIGDESEIIGHRRTYVGACPGRVIQGLKKAGSSNPVFLIDEIDKMTKDYKGDATSTLLAVLDPEQNKLFSDNFIEEEVDLSQVMFIATANTLEKIPSALKDRLEVIEIPGYTDYEKLSIVKTHLLPKICKQHGINVIGIDFKDDAILKIIKHYTKEAGVRELERQIAKIIRKIVTEIVINKIIIKKYVIDAKKVEFYLGHEKYLTDCKNKINQVGVAHALAYTKYGGEVLAIEANYFKGTGKLILTGYLGDIMKESATIAFSYIKANYKYYKVDYDFLINNDIHIHIPKGAVFKDGPSAGITLTTVILSILTKKKIKSTLAMTGEMTLGGNILKIGGLKEKIMGAHRNSIKTIILPEDNYNDIEQIQDEVKQEMEFIFVNNYKQLWKKINEMDN